MPSEDSVRQSDFFTKLLITVVNQKHKSNNNKTLRYLNSSVIRIIFHLIMTNLMLVLTLD